MHHWLISSMSLGLLVESGPDLHGSVSPCLEIRGRQPIVVDEQWAVLNVEIVGFEKRNPFILVDLGQVLHGHALLDNIWANGPLELLAGNKANDRHQPGPGQSPVVLEQLLPVYLIEPITTGLTLVLVLRGRLLLVLATSFVAEHVGPHVSDLP